jgi:hypothetical protein
MSHTKPTFCGHVEEKQGTKNKTSALHWLRKSKIESKKALRKPVYCSPPTTSRLLTNQPNGRKLNKDSIAANGKQMASTLHDLDLTSHTVAWI